MKYDARACLFNMDTGCVELTLQDGRKISIDCTGVEDAPDDAPVPDDAVVSTDNIQHLTELIGQMKPMYRAPLRLLAMGYTNREIADAWTDG